MSRYKHVLDLPFIFQVIEQQILNVYLQIVGISTNVRLLLGLVNQHLYTGRSCRNRNNLNMLVPLSLQSKKLMVREVQLDHLPLSVVKLFHNLTNYYRID